MPTKKTPSLQEFEAEHAKLVSQGRTKEAEELANRMSDKIKGSRPGATPAATAESPVTHRRVGFPGPADDDVAPTPPGENVVITERDFFPTVQDASPPTPPPSGESQAPTDHSHDVTGLAGRQAFCEHCGWLLGKEDVAPEPEDVLQYEISIAGDVPFEKTYREVGGRLEFRFRDISLAETDACSRQARIDLEKGRVADNIAAMEMMARYSLVLSLRSVRVGNEQHDFPENMLGWDVGKVEKGETMLPGILEIVQEETIKSAAIYRIIGKAYGRFSRLVRKLEDNSDNNPFWGGTGSGA